MTMEEIIRVEIPLEDLEDKGYLEKDPQAAAAYLKELGFDISRPIDWTDDVVRPVRILTQKKGVTNGTNGAPARSD